MKKIILIILFYLIVAFYMVKAHGLSPTNLAGPGLDLLVYFLAFTISLVLLLRSILKARREEKSTIQLFIVHLAGNLLVLTLLGYVLLKTP